jgi:hypothetical protein
MPEISKTNQEVMRATITLNILIPVKPNREKGELRILKTGFPQRSRNRCGYLYA